MNVRERKPRKKKKIFEVSLHVKMQWCWLNLLLVENFSIFQEFKILFEVRFNRGNHSDCYKIWLFCLIWDIWWYQWLQAITNWYVNIFFFFLLTNCRNAAFQVHTCAKVELYYSEWQIFTGTFYKPEPHPGPDFSKKMGPNLLTLVKNQTLCFFWMQKPLNIGVCIVHAISNILALALKKRKMPPTL